MIRSRVSKTLNTVWGLLINMEDLARWGRVTTGSMGADAGVETTVVHIREQFLDTALWIAGRNLLRA